MKKTEFFILGFYFLNNNQYRQNKYNANISNNFVCTDIVIILNEKLIKGWKEKLKFEGIKTWPENSLRVLIKGQFYWEGKPGRFQEGLNPKRYYHF